MYSGEVPFDANGHLLDYDDWRVTEWRPNKPFRARMRFDDYQRGRSSALLILRDENGKRWPLFLKDACAVIPRMVNGELDGDWCCCKRGQNFGVQYIIPDGADPRTESKREGVEL